MGSVSVVGYLFYVVLLVWLFADYCLVCCCLGDMVLDFVGLGLDWLGDFIDWLARDCCVSCGCFGLLVEVSSCRVAFA